jgi:hypothetical protein
MVVIVGHAYLLETTAWYWQVFGSFQETRWPSSVPHTATSSI